MSEAAAGQEYIADRLSGASKMVAWYEPYFFGLSSEVGEVPPLAEERGMWLLGAESYTEGDIELLTNKLWEVSGEAQSDIAYFLCGYPDDAMDLFATPNWRTNVQEFGQKIADSEAGKLEAIAQESVKTSVGATLGKAAVVELAPHRARHITQKPRTQPKAGNGTVTTLAEKRTPRKPRGQEYVPSTDGIESLQEGLVDPFEEVDESTVATKALELIADDIDVELLTDSELAKIKTDLDDDSRGMSTDTVRTWLNLAGKRPLLTAADEVELAKRIEAGLFAQERLDKAAAAGEELPLPLKRDLQWVAKDGERSKTHFFESNLRLVVSIAKRYHPQSMTLLDLIQEGNLGMIRAIEMFDYTRGFKFSTYATNWIRQAISRSRGHKDRMVRLPVHVAEKVSKMNRAKKRLTQELGRDPTRQELAQDLHVDEADIEKLELNARDAMSFNMKLDESGDTELGDFIADTHFTDEDAVSNVQVEARNQALQAVLQTLSAREAGIVKLRFGLTDGQPRTLDEIGKVYGVTRERIRQLESLAMSKLRHPSRSQALQPYYDN